MVVPYPLQVSTFTANRNHKTKDNMDSSTISTILDIPVEIPATTTPLQPTETKTEDAMDSPTISDIPVEIPATTSPVKKPKRKTRVGHQHLFVDKVESLPQRIN